MPSDSPEPYVFPAIDASRLNKDVCQEVLNEAQAIVKTQIDASNNLATNLTGLLGQAITLAIAAFGAAALVFPEGSSGKPWMPISGAVGFAVAGVGWMVTAFQAASGFKPRAYEVGFIPDELSSEQYIGNPNPAAALLGIAYKLQPSIRFNAKANVALAKQLDFARLWLIYSPVFGVIVTITAAIALSLWHLLR